MVIESTVQSLQGFEECILDEGAPPPPSFGGRNQLRGPLFSRWQGFTECILDGGGCLDGGAANFQGAFP